MKPIARTLCTVFMAMLVFYSLPLEANIEQPGTFEISLLTKRAKWAGVWDYTVQDVPPEYTKGVLHVSKKKRMHLVQIELPSGTLEAEKVLVEKKKLSFSLTLEGQMIDVSLTLDQDSFSGTSSSPDGVFALQGTRRP